MVHWLARIAMGVVLSADCSWFCTFAQAHESPTQIANAVRKFVAQEQNDPQSTRQISVQVPAAAVHFAQCNHFELSYFGYANPLGSQTVAVHCTQPTSWTLYVPVQIQQRQQVLLAAHSLSAGTILQATDLIQGQTDTSALPGSAISNPSQIIGQRLRFGVIAGQPILSTMLMAPELVHAGQLVTLVAKGNGVKISVTALALESGTLDQRILVRNTQSGRVLQAIVAGSARVQVTF